MSVVCQQLNIMGLCIILGEGKRGWGAAGHLIWFAESVWILVKIMFILYLPSLNSATECSGCFKYLKNVFLMNMKEGNILQK